MRHVNKTTEASWDAIVKCGTFADEFIICQECIIGRRLVGGPLNGQTGFFGFFVTYKNVLNLILSSQQNAMQGFMH